MIIPLYKERDNQECSNYRAKSFLIIGKLYDRFFKRKIKEICGKFRTGDGIRKERGA